MRFHSFPPSETTSLRHAALRYGSAGIPVLPCRPGAKQPLIADWPDRATTEPHQIETWWSRYPDANIGLRTGTPGFDVLDVDVRSDGDGRAVLARLGHAGLLVGALGSVETPSGGRHIYFPGTEQRKSKLSGRYIDFQARGGYVLAPPSRVGTDPTRTKVYRWLDFRPQGGPLNWATAVRHVSGDRTAVPRRSGPARRRRRRTDHGRLVRRSLPGARNATLFYAANRLVEARQNPWSLMEDALATGLPYHEAQSTIESAIKTSGERSG